ncbi:RNA-binding domain-containing protein [Leptospira kmetyi]|uniref:RNA-binding domain-containing protein n=1 Tax=Leptospira kmetyi TaxID=408139 RepID=UPI003EC02205
MKINVISLLNKVKTMPSEHLENETIEFKEYRNSKSLFNSSNEIVEEIVAMANRKGGYIIIGVRDSSNASGQWDSQLVGIEVIDTIEVSDRLKGKIKPNIDIICEYIQFDSKHFLIIKIPYRNDLLFSTSSGKYYRRDNRSSKPMEPHEIEAHIKSLQSYDWSAQDLDLLPSESLDPDSIAESKNAYKTLRMFADPLTDDSFFESLGITKNGLLTKAGLLFLGKPSFIKQYLGNHEIRVSWKTKDGQLKINDVWSGNIWISINKAKAYFKECNKQLDIEFNSKKYKVPLLDEEAFHEAFLNAIVHRDYSIPGMISVTFTGKNLILTSPGKFYGGITSSNIVHHEPRHRNKELARILMLYHLVDRAGMGVYRMGFNSLKYGRKFPIFKETLDSIEVSMQGEYIIPPIFVLIQNKPEKFGNPDMYLLNLMYETGSIEINEILRKFKIFSTNPWERLIESLNNPEISKILELSGSNKGIILRVTEKYLEYMKVEKKFRKYSSSEKHVKLFKHLMKYGAASNEEISKILKYKYASQTSVFLRNSDYVKREGKGNNTIWKLSNLFQ